MKLITLLENGACSTDLLAAHGLSLYLEANGHKILFDMGPGDEFVANAEKLGVDLSAVDIAILSHGHFDHGGGIRAFCAVNSRARLYLHAGAFGDYEAANAEGQMHFIGVDPAFKEFRRRFVITEGVWSLGEGLTLFDAVPDSFGGLGASAKLKERREDGTLVPDVFRHEQDLLVTEGDKALVISGCSHRGSVNIRRRAAELLGREPDVLVGGFHLFELQPGDPAGDALIDRTGAALLEGETVYYTGHCTGDYAYARLEKILDGRLHRIMGGTALEL